MKTSFMKDCFIKIRSGDLDIISGNIAGDKTEDVTVRLRGYAIVPKEEYEKLIISEKVPTKP